jgi:hypothetical protein
MSKRHIDNDEWDASDASDDNESIKSPKTPGSSSLLFKSPETYMRESPKYRENSPGGYCPLSILTK